jgi:D-alanyl-D-alanine carboxypeptidase
MIRISRRGFAVAGLGLLSGCGEREAARTEPAPEPVQPEPLPAPADEASLRGLLDAAIERGGAPAVGAALVSRDGVVFQAVSGVRRMGSPDPVAVGDAWHIGSDTKAMTAALYARLVEAGRAKWGATVPELFPGLGDQIDPAWSGTTVEQLMQHRAGLGEVGVPWLFARRSDTRALTEQRADTAREMFGKPPGAAPGGFLYSNANYIVVGSAIERITGMSWEEAIKAHVFGPLGMERASFGPPRGEAPQGHRANLFSRLEPVGAGAVADNPAAMGPAGTVHLPLADWARFVGVFIDPEQGFLSADSVARLTSPAEGGDYALGWGVIANGPAGRMLAHDGSNTVWYARALLAPETGKAILVASNCGPGAGSEAVEAVSAAMEPLLASAF